MLVKAFSVNRKIKCFKSDLWFTKGFYHMAKRTYRPARPPYPGNWGKVTQVLRRVVGCCEQCGTTQRLTIHHQGVPRPTGDGWRPGCPHDKHDLRRENLRILCTNCHDEIEPCRTWIRERKFRRRCERRAKRDMHRALGIGTGLVLYEERQVA